jgi:regulator of protease activity HflC (stomatin/prohibitin superfamily)
VAVVRQYERGVVLRFGRLTGVRDNVSIGVAAVAYFRRVDPVKSIVEIEDAGTAIREQSISSPTCELMPAAP